MHIPKFVMPFAGGFLGVFVLGAAAFGLVAGSGMQVTGDPAPDLAASTAANVSAVPGTGTAKPSTPHVTVPSPASVPPNSSAPNPAKTPAAGPVSTPPTTDTSAVDGALNTVNGIVNSVLPNGLPTATPS
ncbi:MAG: hypothetical protein JWM17_3047, partial [Actinobacteria bacterium]|nr:hypothetical protein [Actinomycetota bacterium]